MLEPLDIKRLYHSVRIAGLSEEEKYLIRILSPKEKKRVLLEAAHARHVHVEELKGRK